MNLRQVIKTIAKGISLIIAFPSALLCAFGHFSVLYTFFAHLFAIVPGVVIFFFNVTSQTELYAFPKNAALTVQNSVMLMHNANPHCIAETALDGATNANVMPEPGQAMHQCGHVPGLGPAGEPHPD